ncbi:bifunctional diaminohydroxyphosphoribosylaminopyrimidine deaminase/5-amino-6-(5-phosphoribosylamino)uracil reductase RibD [Corynebacterium macclintockiae]|uniref:bifunctional diaminohydroxyphosphoribosylaminopyrimidine deaminase/5-amino-6-(5-phosphoribosylamino)uracil reductase RibD n=1 Tax=Corynebacterium macclintockiae TaxID=2913501 RepID=UPI00254B18ED|nr:bifunctional diaminohydroxyphosphoribosylaminopyrimidine deaminase/5-amino-6-(5-phosphoribosylamino)uracil reductase RibD [Corynebacterium macclintockiae]MDK8890392.1 bifunctional diaminohydroxyphosphoribosylaminopyrimidine deaminase/5-amino-6-(5-phosphoribosylamino)uracil reductase RibD [Corynebacterium macclintockiae]
MDLSLFHDAHHLGWQAAQLASPNPPVGAVIEDPAGAVVGRGYTQRPGEAHAEVMALQQAGDRARGGRAIVTLEPCNHTGHTGPCAEALIRAGIRRVDFLFADPNPVAEGGAATLRAAGVEVIGPYLPHPTGRSVQLPAWTEMYSVEPWLVSMAEQRPHVALKIASTVDGRVAAVDKTSQWITGEEARIAAHRDRTRRDAILVGTGTIAADNPRLTARDGNGEPFAEELQPLRVVMGISEVPADARVFSAPGEGLHLQTRDVHEVLDELWKRDVRTLLVEGGSRVAAAFVSAGVVDEVQYYAAPAVLGAGVASIRNSDDSLGQTIGDIRRFVPRELEVFGSDVRWTMTAPQRTP